MARDKLICDVFSPSGGVEGLRSRLPDLGRVTSVFKALSDETRAKIVFLLGVHEMCVCDLATVLEVTLPAISHHLRILKANGLVIGRREGKMVYYRLSGNHALGIIQEAEDALREARDEEMAEYAL